MLCERKGFERPGRHRQQEQRRLTAILESFSQLLCFFCGETAIVESRDGIFYDKLLNITGNDDGSCFRINFEIRYTRQRLQGRLDRCTTSSSVHRRTREFDQSNGTNGVRRWRIRDRNRA